MQRGKVGFYSTNIVIWKTIGEKVRFFTFSPDFLLWRWKHVKRRKCSLFTLAMKIYFSFMRIKEKHFRGLLSILLFCPVKDNEFEWIWWIFNNPLLIWFVKSLIIYLCATLFNFKTQAQSLIKWFQFSKEHDHFVRHALPNSLNKWKFSVYIQ